MRLGFIRFLNNINKKYYILRGFTPKSLENQRPFKGNDNIFLFIHLASLHI